ncbi:MAG: PQQ-binding-like beta-propeller repeat protein [Deltaproteobacteria bacterium]|nr:PQQ-binding-like beta-propeller repeat protein [Deltaproteobacteria bacterium]
MKSRVSFLTVLSLLVCSIVFSQVNASEYNDNWPTWRGPLFSGETVKGNPPTVWSETKNVQWKTLIPGKGLSTPVIWDDQIFITSAVPLDQKASAEAVEKLKEAQPDWLKDSGSGNIPEYIQQFVVYSIDRKSGKIVWQKAVREQFPHQGTHETGSFASQSCVTDGTYLIASFGSYGIYCFDLKGNMIWEKDLGDLSIRASFGEGSSPALYKDYLIINWDHEQVSHIFVLNKTNGDVIWEKERDEMTSWSTPLVVEAKGKPQLIVSATGKSVAYDLNSGDIIWEISGLTANVIPSPVTDGQMVYLMSGYRGSALQTVNLEEAKGDLKSSSALVWTYDNSTPYVPSPLLYHNRLYFLRGIQERLSCVEATTGKIYYEAQKLDGMKGVYASPVAANGFVYILGRNGLCYVLQDGVEFNVVAKNQLDEDFDASPAIVGDELYMRGLKSLYCIAE